MFRLLVDRHTLCGRRASGSECNVVPTKHHMLLLSLHWEHICPEGATAELSGQHPDTLSLSLSKTLELGAAGAAPSAWAKWDRVLLAWSSGSRGKPPQLLLAPEVGVAHNHYESMNRHHLQPHSSQRHHRGGHCDRIPPVGALAPLGTHPPSAATPKRSGQYPHA